MKLTDKRFLTFLILIASAYMAFAQTLFSVDRISKEDFEKTLNSKFVYVYDIWRDSVVENAITDRIILDARQRFEEIDSTTLIQNYDIGFEDEEYEAMFSIKSLIFVEEYGMYWFMLPSLHDCELYCYDLSGKYLGDMLLPFAISPTGVMVAQKGFDCDGFLDLHFYKRGDSYLREFQTFKNRNLPVSDINNYYTALKYDLSSTSFWLDYSLLYISFPTSDGKMVYLRISLDVEPIEEEIVVIPNQDTQSEGCKQ
jgi:hypothetical protein